MRILAWPAFKNKSRNPFQYNLYKAIINSNNSAGIIEFRGRSAIRIFNFDVLHLHWPEAFIQSKSLSKLIAKSSILIGYIFICKCVGVKIVWTVHNFRRPGVQHEHVSEKIFWKPFLRLVDGLIFMTEDSRKEVFKEVPRLASKKNAVIPHGDYTSMSCDPEHQAPPVNIQYFGAINPYKRVPSLINAFSGIAEAEGLSLRISAEMSAYNPDAEFVTTIGSLTPDVSARIEYENRFQGDDELIAKVKSSDLVVLPYDHVQNSGSALFALSFGTPILAPRIPLFEDLKARVGSEWVILFDGKLTSEDLLNAWRSAKSTKSSKASPNLSYFDWKSIGEDTSKFYADVCSKSI